MKNKIIVKDDPITNFEIEDICRRLGIQLKGVFMKDSLDHLEVGSYVINLQNENQAGSHWCCMICRRDSCVYYDSFGCVPPEPIYQLLKKYYKYIAYNNWIIQNLKSEACGYYCICLLMYIQQQEKKKNNKKSLHQIVNSYVNLFHDDSTKNLAVLKKLFISLQK